MINLIFTLKCLLLNIKYVLIYVPKALAAIFSMCSLYVILSKMTPRYLTLFTNGMFRPVEGRPQAFYLSLPFIDFYVPALTPWPHSSDATLEFVQHATLMFLCCVYPGIVREQSKVYSRCCGGYHLCTKCTVLGQGRNLVAPLPLLSWAEKVRLLLKL
jgi:hypothetical protein